MKSNLPVTNRNVDYPGDKQLISTTDLDSYITYVNDDFIEVSGYAWEELIDTPHNVVRHPDTPPALFKDMWETIRNGEVWNAVLKNRCKNGDHYWVNAYVTPVFAGDEIVGYQSVRSKPTAGEIQRAEQLYQRLNQDRSRDVPRKRRLRDVSLGTGLALVVTILVLLSALKLWDATANHLTVAAALQAAESATENGGSVSPDMRSPLDEMRAVNTHGYYSTVLLAGINIVALVALYLLLRRHVLRPIDNVRGVLKGMAGGQLRQEIPVTSKNEVGELHQSAKLLQARLNTVFGHFSESASALIEASGQLDHTGKRTAQGMENQQDEVEQVATAMNEMASTVDEVARNAAETARAVQDAESQARTGKAQVVETHTAIARLSDRFDRTADSIENLQEHGDRIDTIIQVIGGIADQTNLLALNAAIEAARAGEHGRGFAVVAGEVRSLARKTQDSTQKIREMIETLRVGIHDSVDNVRAGRTQMETVEEQASATDQALTSISATIDTITDMSSQIATATEEQSAVAEEMSRNITGIASQTERATEDSRQVVESGQRLSSMSTKFEALLSQFSKG